MVTYLNLRDSSLKYAGVVFRIQPSLLIAIKTAMSEITYKFILRVFPKNGAVEIPP